MTVKLGLKQHLGPKGGTPFLRGTVIHKIIHTKERFMDRPSNYYRYLCHLIILVAFFSVVPSAPPANSAALKIPDNAQAQRYGGGWKCDLGYRKVKKSCRAIKLPQNAYLTDASFGQGWECKRGYRERKGKCAAVKVPANAFLNSYGEGWECQ
ncbi:MAG: hypothetical protein HOB37_12500, partial [Rhodospirillaceae bacterium]|nr:hypothetical protein [Rhodospirillaceae bacterium]